VAFLVDGQAFFSALASALERARFQILFLGWDFHGGERLRRRGRRERRDELLGLLAERLAQRPELRVYGLGWGLGSLLAFSREPLPRLQLGLHSLDRLDFRLDRCHPSFACHHQKVVVVDDTVAFAGGFDVTAYRWDSRQHRPHDPRRTTPEGDRYGPFHDVQVAVEGPAAAALGELARERWFRATRERLPRPPLAASAWPVNLASALEDVEVGIARTEPGYGGPRVREVERLYLASIRAARRILYVENQYFTSERLVEALAARLDERDGPELVIVLPARCPWLEQATMGRLRAAVLARLRAADRYGRLGIYAPRVAPDVGVNVHAKVMTVDDELARIGSSNLSRRSLEFDTECDLAVEAAGRADVRDAIARLRSDLLAEHLGRQTEEVHARAAERGSWLRAIEELRAGPRTLEPVEVDPLPGALALAFARLLDPAAPDERAPRGSSALRAAFAVAAAALVLVALLGLLA
jgi:phosphatidylserine/phosphatidylglycerophosphate/cardiolipin synthase-like enzyme